MDSNSSLWLCPAFRQLHLRGQEVFSVALYESGPQHRTMCPGGQSFLGSQHCRGLSLGTLEATFMALTSVTRIWFTTNEIKQMRER